MFPSWLTENVLGKSVSHFLLEFQKDNDNDTDCLQPSTVIKDSVIPVLAPHVTSTSNPFTAVRTTLRERVLEGIIRFYSGPHKNVILYY